MTPPLRLDDVLAATHGRLLRRVAAEFARVSTDGRTAAPGDLFVALRGERFDGHEFVAQARARGAAGAIVSREVEADGLTIVLVDDTRIALGDVARERRSAFPIPLVAITGSNGKTTTKDFCAAILAAAGPTLATEGNLNNDVGLPLTVLRLAPGHRFAVVEMGMSARGEIAYLASIAAPDVGVVTNVAPAHVGRLGSIEAIARAKGELFHAIGARGTAVLPGDEPLLMREAAHLPPERRVRFGEGPTDDARLLAVEPDGRAGQRLRLLVGGHEIAARITVPGRHNARNALAAAAAAAAVGAGPDAIARGLEGARFSAHRSALCEIAGRAVLDDCYNANPGSTAAALDALADLRGPGARVVAVLGDMLELGAESRRLHAEIGRRAAERGVDFLVCVGDFADALAEGAIAAGMPAACIARTRDRAEAARAAFAAAAPGDLLLVKGSRGARLEEVVYLLRAESR